MKEIIYKFLDESVGKGANCSPIISEFRTWTEKYQVLSDNGTLILWFAVKTDQIKVYRSESLCRKIEGYFGIDPDEIKVFRSDSLCRKIDGYFGIDPNESWKYVRDWFGDRHNIKVLSDLLKLILKEEHV
jgi:hypothetical protein